MTIINNSPFYGATGNLPGFSARSVNTLNNLDSDINIITENGLSLGVSGSSISLTNTGVRLINGLSGAIDLVAGTAVNFNIVGNTLTINSSDIILPGASYSIGGAGILVTQTPGSSAATVSNIGVLSYNGITGNIQGVSGAIAGAGISLSAATGAVTISNFGVLSFNGLTGAVAGASLGANTFTGAQTASSGFVGPLTGTASNASALGGTGAADWVLKKDSVASFNGLTGAVGGVTTSVANTFILLNTFAAGISASGATFTGNITAPNIVASFNGNTGAVVGASLGANTFTGLNTFAAGISASGATFTGNITAPNIVTSFNGVTGAVGITAGSNVTIDKNGNTYTINAILSGSGAATNVANTFTLLNTFAAGISATGATFTGNITISSSGFSGPLGGTASNASALGGTGAANWTLKKDSVASFNGNTGAVVGASLGANTFTEPNTFNAGISATGATFSGNITISSSGFSGPLAGTASNASALGGTAASFWTLKKDSVASISASTGISITPSGGTGAITISNTGVQSIGAGTGISINQTVGAVTITNVGASLGANTFTGAQTASSGFVGPLTGLASNASALGGTGADSWTLKKDSVSSFNGNTGAVAGASLGTNTFTGIQTASGFVGPLTGLASSAAVASNASALGGTASSFWTLKKDSVASFNGVTGAVGISAGSNVTIAQFGNASTGFTYTINAILSGSGAETNVANTFILLNTFAAGISASGATFTGNIKAPNIVTSFNGNTGAVVGASLGANTFTEINTFNAGISATGATFSGNITISSSGFSGPLGGTASNASALGGTAAADWVLKKDNVASFNGNTGAVVGASLGANTFTGLNTFAAGISASGATFTGNITISSSGFSGPLGGTASNASALGGTAAADWVLKKDNVASFNGNTGAVVGASLGANTFTGIQTASGFVGPLTGLASSAAVASNASALGGTASSFWTLKKDSVASFNGNTGAVVGASLGANTFTEPNTFNAGISATGATFSGNITISSSGFSGPLAGTASNASALGGTASSFWTLKKDSVASFNGVTGAVGITAGSNVTIDKNGNTYTINAILSDSGAETNVANTFILLNTFAAGISASGATFTGKITATGATFGSLAVTGDSLFSGAVTVNGNFQVIGTASQVNFASTTVVTKDNIIALGATGGGAGITGDSVNDRGVAFFYNNTQLDTEGVSCGFFGMDITSKNFVYYQYGGTAGVGSAGGFTGTIEANFKGATATFDKLVVVSSINATSATFTGNITAPNIVTSFNGNTGAVVGASLGANTFTGLNKFAAGISASGATFTGNITAPNIVASFNGNTGAVVGASLGANTFTGLNTFAAGISANTILSESYKVSKDAVNIQTATSYALQMSDNGKIITCNNASPITVTLPTAVDNTRFTCTVIQLGDGVVQFAVASANETMTSYLGKTKLAGKYASAIILNIASSTSSKQYVITGNLSY